jgi:AraC-like DNA-binding protein
MDQSLSFADALAAETVTTLFSQLQEVLFWVKDSSHRIVHLNQAFADRVNRSPEAIIGKTDADLYYSELASVFLQDDEKVLQSGHAIYNKIELLTSPWGGIEWRSTTKLPLIAKDGTIIGTAGISQPLPDSGESLPMPYRNFASIVELARRRLREGISVEHIARESGMSIATLERRFKEHLNQSPSTFLAQLRTSRACELLRMSPLNMTEIATECGYESPAAFSRAFRRVMQQAPSTFRKVYRTNQG